MENARKRKKSRLGKSSGVFCLCYGGWTWVHRTPYELHEHTPAQTQTQVTRQCSDLSGEVGWVIVFLESVKKREGIIWWDARLRMYVCLLTC
jgi:hypothetical protein